MNEHENRDDLGELEVFINGINDICRQTTLGMDTVNALLPKLAGFCRAGTALCDLDGRVLAETDMGLLRGCLFNESDGGVRCLEPSMLAGVENQRGAIWNIPVNCFLPECAVFSAAPVSANTEKLGVLLLVGRAEVTGCRRIALGTAAVVAGLALAGQKHGDASDTANKTAAVKAALDTLSFSELTAAIEIFDELEGTTGCVVASRIAGRSGVKRSAIVNALRKLASASIVESRSLGVKGTYINVQNAELLVELCKLKKR